MALGNPQTTIGLFFPERSSFYRSLFSGKFSDRKQGASLRTHPVYGRKIFRKKATGKKNYVRGKRDQLSSADCQVPINQTPRNKRCPKAKKQKNCIQTDREVTTVVTSKARGGNHADLLPQTLPSNFLASTFALPCFPTSSVYAFLLLV